MHAEFWHRCWSDSDIGFHEEQANPFLVRYLPGRLTAQDSRIFLPLCGKTSSIAWLLAQGYRVVGVELSPIAIEQLFEALGIEPKVSIVDDLVHYQADNLDLYVGDFFALTPKRLGQVDAIFDRGSPGRAADGYARALCHSSADTDLWCATTADRLRVSTNTGGGTAVSRSVPWSCTVTMAVPINWRSLKVSIATWALPMW